MALLSPGRKDAAPRATGRRIRRNRGEKAARRSDLAMMVKSRYVVPAEARFTESADHMFG